ncbi:MAG: hypothetical protein ACI9QL_003849 [Candidatus Omnitrophota bacterium]|jgi:hypothetical protein
MATATHSDLYGIIARFDNSTQLTHAADAAREAGYTVMDGYSPVPVHDLDAKLGRKRSRLPYITLCGGLAGAALGLLLQTWVCVWEYPMNVGGRPFFSWPSFIPVTYECTILLAALSCAFFMCFLNGLVKPYQSIFNAPGIERASIDKFFLCIETADPKFNHKDVSEFLHAQSPESVDDVPK